MRRDLGSYSYPFPRLNFAKGSASRWVKVGLPRNPESPGLPAE